MKSANDQGAGRTSNRATTTFVLAVVGIEILFNRCHDNAISSTSFVFHLCFIAADKSADSRLLRVTSCVTNMGIGWQPCWYSVGLCSSASFLHPSSNAGSWPSFTLRTDTFETWSPGKFEMAAVIRWSRQVSLPSRNQCWFHGLNLTWLQPLPTAPFAEAKVLNICLRFKSNSNFSYLLCSNMLPLYIAFISFHLMVDNMINCFLYTILILGFWCIIWWLGIHIDYVILVGIPFWG